MKNTKTTCVTLNYETYHKLNIIATVKKYFYDPNASMAKIVNIAIEEYFEKHNDEINKMMDEYHEKGGCFYL